MSEYPPYLFKSFAKTAGLCVRVFREGACAYYYSSTHLTPDPVAPHVASMRDAPHRAGVLLTPLYQHYGYARLGDGALLVLGPTAALRDEPAELQRLAEELGVPEGERAAYLQSLCCAPNVTAEGLAWMLSFFVTAVEGQAFGVENVHIDTGASAFRPSIAQAHTRESFDVYENTDLSDAVNASYRFERIANEFIRKGQIEHIAELFAAIPSLQAGKMAKDVMRQYKNMCICAATTFSRAAIEGGLDPQSSFKLSDLYIQRCELLRDPDAILQLIREMGLDFATRVHDLDYGEVLDARFFEDCTRYVKQNLFSRIRVKDMADHLGLSSAYVSTRFHAICGKTLGQFIQERKIDEAKLMLCYDDRSVADIAMHLAFSSQSHFQNVFKRWVSMTPLEYRRRCGEGEAAGKR